MEILPARQMIARTGAFILTIGFLVTPLNADAPPAPPTPTTPSSPQADPFVKKDSPVPQDESGPVTNLVMTFEVYRLSQTDGSALIQANATDEARHDRALELVKSGKAKLDAVLCGTVISGEQLVVEQVDAFRAALAFFCSAENGVVAMDFKTRNIGYRVVIRGQESVDKKGFNGVMFFENARLKGYADLRMTNGTALPYTASLAQYDTQRVNSIPPYFPFEKTCFLGTYSPAPQGSLLPKTNQPNTPLPESQMALVFGKISRFQLEAARPVNKPIGLEQQFSLYSMDRDAARQILSQKQEANSAYQAVQALVKSKQAKLEHLSVLRTTDGVKSNFDEINEVPYPTGGGGIETQDVGMGVMVQPTFIGHSSLLTLDISKCQLLNYLENLPVEGVSAYYHQTMPLFEVRSIVTSIHSGLGEHELLGTISPAGDTGVPGQQDTGRAWLEFVQTMALNP